MAPTGISIAFDDAAMEAGPAWTRIDTTYRVNSWAIDRGRSYETGKTDTGRATIQLTDTTGAFDPTNATSPFYGQLDPLKQAAICLQNPVTSAWSTLFRGFVSEWRIEPYPTMGFNTVTVVLVDALALLAATELIPELFGGIVNGTSDGTTPPASAGDIYYGSDTALDACRLRLIQVLDEIGWSGTGQAVSELRQINSGNVGLQEVVYSPRSTGLEVAQDIADAEWPDVANLYVAGPRKPGAIMFHGRFPRFRPEVVEYDINTWQAGDDAAAIADPTNVVRISPPFVFFRDDATLFTDAIATPRGIDQDDIAGQYVSDIAAADAYGTRTWSAEDLLTQNGDGPTNAIEETAKISAYVINRYAAPFTRVGQLTCRPQKPSGVHGPATWEIMCGVDLNDIVSIKTTHAGGGGFDNEEFFVEGIHYEAVPMNPDQHEVTLRLDVSPRGAYNYAPFA